MGSKFCKDCQHWLCSYENVDGKFGTCDHPLVEDKIIMDMERGGEEVIHTHEDFGCIYHTPLHGNVVSKLPGSSL